MQMSQVLGVSQRAIPVRGLHTANPLRKAQVAPRASMGARRDLPGNARRTLKYRPTRMRAGDAAPYAEADEKPYDDAISSWEELKTTYALSYAVSAGLDDVEALIRLAAAEPLGPQTTFDCLAPAGAALYYGQELDGSLYNSSTVIDSHFRLLKDCLILDNYQLVKDTYNRLAKAEPKMEPKFIQATAVVGGQALEHLKEEHEFVVSMLQEQVEGGVVDEAMRRDYQKAKALCDAVDKVIAALPLPA
mmetsp:Transcript_15863/g.26784  ORF Transcript_15863/g.26784 Transcript_15863/m.26784 type:complete len:247 (+) Transcript_15863:1-741(+)